MPIYEYQCSQCGHVQEAFQKFSDPPLAQCGHCAGQLRKLISQSAFHLKGSGWYVTDYSRKNTGSAVTSKTGAESDSSTASTTAGDTSKASAAPSSASE